MALTEYAQAGEIRAALGVNTHELPDTVINLPMYENVLLKELKGVSATCIADFRVVDAITKTDRTEAENDFHAAVELFSVFTIARHLTVSLPLFSPKTIGDGKAAVTRFSDSPYKQTIEAVKASYDEYRVYLKSTYAEYSGGSVSDIVPIPLVGIMSPGSDPVTEG